MDGNDRLTVALDPDDFLDLILDPEFDSLVINSGKIRLATFNTQVDVATSDATLIFTTNSSEHDAFLAEMHNFMQTGRNGGLWNGSGIASSGAAASEQHLLSLAAVGSWQIDPSTSSNDVFIKLVQNGDTDIDGDIDADDYAHLDAAWANPPSPPSWFSGDFNYNSVIDSDDFFLIDHAFSA
jgi:hypothetical protein